MMILSFNSTMEDILMLQGARLFLWQSIKWCWASDGLRREKLCFMKRLISWDSGPMVNDIAFNFCHHSFPQSCQIQQTRRQKKSPWEGVEQNNVDTSIMTDEPVVIVDACEVVASDLDKSEIEAKVQSCANSATCSSPTILRAWDDYKWGS